MPSQCVSYYFITATDIECGENSFTSISCLNQERLTADGQQSCTAHEHNVNLTNVSSSLLQPCCNVAKLTRRFYFVSFTDSPHLFVYVSSNFVPASEPGCDIGLFFMEKRFVQRSLIYIISFQINWFRKLACPQPMFNLN